MDALQSGNKARKRPRTWQNYVEDLAWSHFGVLPAESQLVQLDRNAWRRQLELPKRQVDK